MTSAKALSSNSCLFLLDSMRSAIYSLLARFRIHELIKSTVLEFRTAVAGNQEHVSSLAFKNYQISTVLTYMMMLASVLVGTCKGSKLQKCECFLCAFISLPIVDLSFQEFMMIEALVAPFLSLFE